VVIYRAPRCGGAGKPNLPPPKSLTVDLLRSTIANRVQEQAFGTLDRYRATSTLASIS
jgi:hypothetical protein